MICFVYFREFPPSREEIISLLVNLIIIVFCFYTLLVLMLLTLYLPDLLTQGRRELSAVVHCYGGGSCKITINSATTAGEVMSYLQCL